MDSLLFSTPEQRVLRLLVSEPTTAFTPRVISSKLKGVRGLGGVDGIMRVLHELEELGLVDFVDNRRSVRLQDENSTAHLLKRVSAVCDLESLRKLLEPICSRGILFGSRASGKARSDSDYDLFVVSDTPDEAVKIGQRHPLGKALELVAWTAEQFGEIQSRDPELAEKLNHGIVLWGPNW
ncbi:MAG: nucleotidyltransferase domain-containing protein [Oligoflexia bacterium]|nr:nucleotidyltransferase domain-containing protein [Oligoflexia bacterium]